MEVGTKLVAGLICWDLDGQEACITHIYKDFIFIRYDHLVEYEFMLIRKNFENQFTV